MTSDQIRQRLEAMRAEQKARLDDSEIAALSYALEQAPAGEIHLFGSRVDADKKGGDIDLLLFTDADAFETSRLLATRFFSQCEEKIDVIVMNPRQLTEDQVVFLAHIEKVKIL